MELSKLTAISPIDGRYRVHTEKLDAFFSEYALIKYRIRIEVEYFVALCKLPLPQLKTFDKKHFTWMRKLYTNFTIDFAKEIKEIERSTNHDVKAVEYFIKKRFDEKGLSAYAEFIHFGLTSQDINNTAIPLLLKEGLALELVPYYSLVVEKLLAYAEAWENIPMLARTHGQPASPTRLGKEIMVFVERLWMQLSMIQSVPFSAKFGGATGNLNAHFVAYPKIEWINFANNFVEKTLGLVRSQATTQIEHYDNMAALFDNLKRLNTILIDLDRDIWTYISMGYFKQKIVKGEVGSSAMPHKVNPIDFENSEGNLGIANALFEHLSAKLPISRLQRDLTDSTVLRNVGVPIAHSLIALKSLIKGLDKLIVDQKTITHDLDDNWVVISEAIQTVLRREAYPKPYEALKELTRSNEKITKEKLHDFIETLKVSPKIKKELMAITPYNYTGL